MQEQVLEQIIESTVWGQPVRFPSGGGEMFASLHRPPQAVALSTSESQRRPSGGDETEQTNFAPGAGSSASGASTGRSSSIGGSSSTGSNSSASETKYPALLIVHGLGGSRHDFNGILMRTAIHAAMNGFIVLRVDFRGHGESTGNTMSVTLQTLLADFNAAMQYLHNVEGVDEERVSVLGLSLGGTVAAIGASRRADVKNLVMWESPYDLMGTFRRLLGPITMMMIRTHGYLQAGLVQVSAEFCDQFENLKPDAETEKYKGRVLLVHGSRDHIVLPEESEKWKTSFRRTECKLQLVEGADHPFTKEPWANEAIKHTLSWLGVKERV
jgi:Dipeptidyl aminopeptidases/acylaminoacyl-peptidases